MFLFGPISQKFHSATLGVSCRSDLEIGECGGVDKCLVLCRFDTGRDLRRALGDRGNRIIGVLCEKYFLFFLEKRKWNHSNHGTWTNSE